MFRNLEAEQARLRLTNQKVADILEISRVSYENKKRQENLRHGKSKNYAAFLNASLTICSQKRTRRERERDKEKNNSRTAGTTQPNLQDCRGMLYR